MRRRYRQHDNHHHYGLTVVDQQPPPAQFAQVTLGGVGPVSLAPLDELRAARHAAYERADALAAQGADLEARAEDRLADAGALLVPRRDWWLVPLELAPQMVKADRLVARIARLDQRGADGDRLFSRLRRYRRARAASRLRSLLVRIARGGGESGVEVPDVEPLLEEAASLAAHAQDFRGELDLARARLGELDHETRLREAAVRRLGFDSLHLAAHFRAYGLPLVQSPVGLDAGEKAHLAVDAALAPPVPMAAAGRDGWPDSLASTGIHHWVGTFRSGPAPISGAQPIDTGVLVVTDQRLVFGGRAGTVAVPLAGMLAMDVYGDAVAVLQLGRDAGDLFLVPEPRLLAFYANWLSENV